MALSRPRVLIIDDEPQVRELWAEFALACGWDPTVAADGPEGLARFEAGHYDVVVTDIRLPGMNGRAVPRMVRQRDPDVGVILITGSISDEDTDPASEPAVMLLRKPINFTDFQAALRRCRARVTSDQPRREL
jgi:CheY-like chemotaxis protein